MPERPPDHPPALVTDEPGLDPVSGRPWGEETPGKRIASYSLIFVLAVVATVWVFVERPSDGRAVVVYVLGPAGVVLFGVRLRKALGEFRADRRPRAGEP